MGSPLDPFAKDVFAVPSRNTIIEESTTGNLPNNHSNIVSSSNDSPSWARHLTRITKEEAQSSSSIPTLPLTFNLHLLQVLKPCIAHYMHLASADVSIAAHDFRETTSPLSTTASSIYVLFDVGSQAVSIPFIVAIENAFAISIIDQILGGTGKPSGTLRNLSITEISVLEFLFLNLVFALNESYGSPIFRLVSVGFSLPSLSDVNLKKSLLTRTVIGLKRIAGTILIWTPTEILRILSREHHLLLENYPETLKLPADLPRSAFVHMERIAPELSLNIQIGQTEVLLGNLRQLEPEDIFIIQRPQVELQNGHIKGKLRLRVGDGKLTTIAGKVVTNPDKERRTQILVEQITSGDEPLDIEELDTSESRQSPAEGSAVLDGLLLTIHVELGARRIRLDELAHLRIGQVVNLGCAASDPVDLTCDGRRIARGELIDIEGHLGVRITQLLT